MQSRKLFEHGRSDLNREVTMVCSVQFSTFSPSLNFISNQSTEIEFLISKYIPLADYHMILNDPCLKAHEKMFNLRRQSKVLLFILLSQDIKKTCFVRLILLICHLEGRMYAWIRSIKRIFLHTLV